MNRKELRVLIISCYRLLYLFRRVTLFLLQVFCQLSHGSCSMADAVLDFFAQFSKTLVVAFWYEDRVIAETFCAVFLGGDAAVYYTLELVDLLDAGTAARTHILLLYIADDGTETGFAVLFSIEFAQEF